MEGVEDKVEEELVGKQEGDQKLVSGRRVLRGLS